VPRTRTRTRVIIIIRTSRYIPYDIYPIRLDPLRRPLAKIGTLPVDSGVARVNGGGFSFDMKVWWPETGPSGCMPAVVILHPVQVFSAEAGESEYQQTCEHLASMNVICFISLESTGQFGSGTTRKEQTGLADRAMEMWNHIRRQSTIPSSPLYRRVCNKLGVTGYSMGSGSAALMASMYSQPRWGIKALGYIHGTLVGADKLRAIDVPTMIGGGTGDTLVNADRQFKNFDSATNRNPTIAVLLKGAPHVTGPCGNTCPVIQSCCRGTYFYGGHMQIVTGQFSAHTKWLIPFFFAYLKGDLEASRAIWETDQIENDDRVDHVLRSPRVAAALPTLVFENDEWVTAKSGATEAPAAEGAAAVEAKPSRPDDSVIEVQSAQHTVSSILEVTAFTNATGLPYSLVLDGITTMARVRNALGRGADSDDSLCEDLLSVIPVPWASETPAMLQDETSQGVTVNSIQESRFIEIRNELAAQTSLDVFVGRTVTDEEAAAESAPEQEPDAPMYRRTWWGELVPIPTDTSRVFYYDWSQPTTFYAAISSSCLPAHIKNVTCSLRFRVVNEKDGATLSNPVTRLVRVAH